MDGRSCSACCRASPIAWRDHILYEYHWEWNFPATPTTFAIRTDRYKYIFYHGLWDHNGFYDLETDPHERHNLINVPAFQELAESLQKQLFDELEASGGLTSPCADRLANGSTSANWNAELWSVPCKERGEDGKQVRVLSIRQAGDSHRSLERVRKCRQPPHSNSASRESEPLCRFATQSGHFRNALRSGGRSVVGSPSCMFHFAIS